MRAFRLLRRVAELHYPVTELSAFDYDLVEIALTEKNKRESFRLWKANQQPENQ